MNDYERLTPKELLKESERLKNMAQQVEQSYPDWYDGKSVDEVAYCKWLMSKQEMRCISHKLYGMDGYIDDEEMKSNIVKDIQLYVRTNLYKKASQILDALKAFCFAYPVKPTIDRIHFKNGTYHLEKGFTTEREWTMNRFPVEYHEDAQHPVRWLQFLSELFYEEDILTVQEFLGYSLIGTNKGQSMLMIIGNGGEGKSRICTLMQAIMGNNMNVGDVSKLETDRFALANLEDKMLMIDDDINLTGLQSTNVVKAVVTCDGLLSVEFKNKQAYQGMMYARIICLGNGNLKSLYDKSMGFYRRQLVIQTKEKPENRVDDPFLSEKLEAEIPGIVIWCLDGLHRLIRNNYKFSVSERSGELKKEMMEEDNNIQAFLTSTGYVRFDKTKESSTSELYSVYQRWCSENAEKYVSVTTFSKYLKQNAERLELEYKKNIPIGLSRYQRGYRGIETLLTGFMEILPEKEKDVPFLQDENKARTGGQ